MTQFEDILETILEEYARRDSEGEFDTWEETDAFVKEKAEVLLAYVKEEPVSICHDASKKSDNPEDVVIINPSDNTGEVLTKCIGVNQGHIWAYTSELLKLDNLCNIGKNLQEPQVKESAEFQHDKETCKENGDSLTQEPVSEDLEIAANEWDAKASFTPFYMVLDDKGNPNGVRQDYTTHAESFKAGAKWQKEKEYTCYEEAFEDGAKWKVENLWKPADGDDLPEINREVIALLDNGKVVFAHRPPEYWDGKNIITGKVTRYYPKTYGKGGWNIPDVKWWLDIKLPKEIEL